MSFLSHDETVALLLSLKVASVAMACTLPPAVACAWLLARKHFIGKPVFEAVLLLPLILPPVVTGYALLALFGHQGAIGRVLDALHLSIAFRWTGAALAAGVMAFPLLVIALRGAFEAVDRKLEQAAATLGASGWRIFFGITLPLSLPGLAAGLALAFARAFGEFGATITFVSSIPGQTRTLPIALYELLETPGGEGGALRLTWVALVVALVATLGAAMLLRRGPRAAGQDT
ncbi:MAG TPA: molybdate ABC transporter permease subunit [Rhodanobacteraceae bacterium]|nr:molybdate ABC transporter permease subunit [Rhodanobacteraceae bacterium]